MRTYVKRVEAMQIKTVADCRRAVEMIEGAELIKNGNKIDGFRIPQLRSTYSIPLCVWLGQWAFQSQNGKWDWSSTMDGWTEEPAP